MSLETINSVDSLGVDNKVEAVQPDVVVAPESNVVLQDVGFDEVAAYYAWEDDVRRQEAAKIYGLESTASWAEIQYHEEQARIRAEWEEELTRKRILMAKFAAGHVIPEQEKLRKELSDKISRLYRGYLDPTRTEHYDPETGILVAL